MKILHTVEFYKPIPSGMSEVVSQLSERLVEMGHQVTIATTKSNTRSSKIINGVEIMEFDISGNFVNGLSGEVERYREFLVKGDFDIITNFAAQQWATDIMLPILPLIKARKVFVPTGFSGFYSPNYDSYFELMKGWMNHYDMNLFLSDNYRDINFARENGIKKTLLVPNGADEREFLKPSKINIRKLLGIPNDNTLILSVGSHTGKKGHAEAIEIFRQANITKATLLIIGNSFGSGCSDFCAHAPEKFNSDPLMKSQSKQLIITFVPRAETVAAYQESDLFLFPSNIECSPIVLFEAMASKTPFLVTDVGNSAEIVTWSSGGQVLPTSKDDIHRESFADIAESAKLLAKLLSDKASLSSMAENGYRNWLDKFTWAKITEQYESIYKNLLRQPSSYQKQLVGAGIDVVVYNQSDTNMLSATLDLLHAQSYKPAHVYIVGEPTKLGKRYPNLLIEYIDSSSTAFTDVLERVLARLGKKVIFLSEPPVFDTYYLEELTRLSVTHPGVSLIYPNYSTMLANKSYNDRFASQELGMHFFGKNFNQLASSNKIHATLDGALIDVAKLRESLVTASGLKHYFEWDLWLRLTQSDKYLYVFVYTPLSAIKSYLQTYLKPDREYLNDQVHLYNLWSEQLRLLPKSWANFLCWRLTSQFWDRESIRLVNRNLTQKARQRLFLLTSGSFKWYLFIYVAGQYSKILIYTFREFYMQTKLNVKRIIQIISMR